MERENSISIYPWRWKIQFYWVSISSCFGLQVPCGVLFFVYDWFIVTGCVECWAVDLLMLSFSRHSTRFAYIVDAVFPFLSDTTIDTCSIVFLFTPTGFLLFSPTSIHWICFCWGRYLWNWWNSLFYNPFDPFLSQDLINLEIISQNVNWEEIKGDLFQCKSFQREFKIAWQHRIPCVKLMNQRCFKWKISLKVCHGIDHELMKRKWGGV